MRVESEAVLAGFESRRCAHSVPMAEKLCDGRLKSPREQGSN